MLFWEMDWKADCVPFAWVSQCQSVEGWAWKHDVDAICVGRTSARVAAAIGHEEAQATAVGQGKKSAATGDTSN
ncbi:hypothetical protein N9L68_02525 [bacterium]|nr:hypothetical protein [bacterium]